MKPRDPGCFTPRNMTLTVPRRWPDTTRRRQHLHVNDDGGPWAAVVHAAASLTARLTSRRASASG
ncbi:MAG TPA: hypothetical protein VF800_04115, partial [Telluria sp.]